MIPGRNFIGGKQLPVSCIDSFWTCRLLIELVEKDIYIFLMSFAILHGLFFFLQENGISVLPNVGLGTIHEMVG